MRYLITLFLLISGVLSASAWAETKTITITPATERVDGSALPAEEISSHLIECSRNDGAFEALDTLEMPTVVQQYDFAPGDWQCRAWTLDIFGQMSAEASLSNPFFVVPPIPMAPTAVEVH